MVSTKTPLLKHYYRRQGIGGKKSPTLMILLILPGKANGPTGPREIEKCPPAGTGTKKRLTKVQE